MAPCSDGKTTTRLPKLETPRLTDVPGSFCMYAFRSLDGSARAAELSVIYGKCSQIEAADRSVLRNHQSRNEIVARSYLPSTLLRAGLSIAVEVRDTHTRQWGAIACRDGNGNTPSQSGRCQRHQCHSQRQDQQRSNGPGQSSRNLTTVLTPHANCGRLAQGRNPDNDARKDAFLVSIQAPSLAAADLNALE
jgi:hypothetical protein